MSLSVSARHCSLFWGVLWPFPARCPTPTSACSTPFWPVAGGLIGFIGHTLIDLSWGGSPWWSWVIASAFVGVVVGLFSKKLNLQEGEFSKKQVAFFALANIVAHLLAWILVAPVLDIAIYAEPVKKVFAQGAFAAVSNSITAVVVGGLLVLAYTRTIAKKGSLDQE